MRNVIRIALCAFVALAVAPWPGSAEDWDRSNASGSHYILRAPADELVEVAARRGLTVVHLETDEASGEQVALVTNSLALPPETIAGDSEVLGFEPAAVVNLPIAGLDQSTASVLEQSTASVLEGLARGGVLDDGSIGGYFSGPLWAGYADQAAAAVIRLREAHAMGWTDAAYGEGVVVAVIDNGVDPDHPMLRDALVPGYDFLQDEAGFASEWNNLDQSTASVLEQSTASVLEAAVGTLLTGQGSLHGLEQSTASVLEQSTASVLEGLPLPPAFGHGTMVAGLVRLVTPGASIMPLRAFDGDGAGNLYDIVRAIRFAVANGAQVINMSFSSEAYSPELARAINEARQAGVICVAAAGNRSERVITYPAALGTSLGVASTGLDDSLSAFSNHGSDLVSLSAPGEALISTFPGGSYAVSSGTSFSTPLVAGTVALLTSVVADGVQPQDAWSGPYALASGARFLPDLTSEVAAGRLDAAAARAALAQYRVALR